VHEPVPVNQTELSALSIGDILNIDIHISYGQLQLTIVSLVDSRLSPSEKDSYPPYWMWSWMVVSCLIVVSPRLRETELLPLLYVVGDGGILVENWLSPSELPPLLYVVGDGGILVDRLGGSHCSVGRVVAPDHPILPQLSPLYKGHSPPPLLNVVGDGCILVDRLGGTHCSVGRVVAPDHSILTQIWRTLQQDTGYKWLQAKQNNTRDLTTEVNIPEFHTLQGSLLKIMKNLKQL
jgi:hypothetical protein